MRITPTMTMATTMRDLNGAYSRLVFSQSQMSSGKRLTRASDDPNVANLAMSLRRTLSRQDIYDRSIQDAKGWLGTADSALVAASDNLIRAKEVVVRASNTGGLSDPGARQAMVADIRAIRDDLIAVANTTYGGRSVFAGTAGGKAYSAAGAYLGNGGSVVRDVDPNTSVTVNVTGVDAFGDPAAAGGDVFAVLDRMATAIANGDEAGLAAAHTQLDAATQRLNGATVLIGTRGSQMDTREARAGDERVRVTSLLSQTEDVDLAQVMVDLKARENSYNASLQVAAAILPKSLADFLR